MQKIPTLYVRDPDDRSRVIDQVSAGCEWVFAGEGEATVKYDGTCVLIEHETVAAANLLGLSVYCRREVKAGKEAPDYFVEVGIDPVTGHRMGWVPYSASGFAAFINEALTMNVDGDPDPADWPEGTYELCGPAINNDRQGYGHHVLIRHDTAERIPALHHPESFEQLRTAILAAPAEGVVWWHPDGRRAKLKARDFGKRTTGSYAEANR